MAENCKACRFWRPEPGSGACPVEGPAFGWCRQSPPRIIDHIARMSIPTPGFGGRNVDREDVAPAARVQECTLFPATTHDDWCGRFERPGHGEMPC